MEDNIYNLFIGKKNFMAENANLDLLVPFMLNDGFLMKFEEASNVEASIVEASNVEASNVEASNVKASNVEASNVSVPIEPSISCFK